MNATIEVLGIVLGVCVCVGGGALARAADHLSHRLETFSDASSPQSLGIGSIAIITDSLSPLHFIGTNNSQLKHGQLTMTLARAATVRVQSGHSDTT